MPFKWLEVKILAIANNPSKFPLSKILRYMVTIDYLVVKANVTLLPMITMTSIVTMMYVQDTQDNRCICLVPESTVPWELGPTEVSQSAYIVKSSTGVLIKCPH